MPVIADLPPAKASEARERLLAAAQAIFYAEGINSVGVDRIVSEGHVTRATFYRHFAGKQDLVLACLQAAHDAYVARTSTHLTAGLGPIDVLRAIARDIVYRMGQDDFRGCEFINAASEFEDPDGPIRQAVDRHRAWFAGVLEETFAAASHEDPEAAARHYVMLRDGAMVGAYLGDPAATGAGFLRGIEKVLEQLPRSGGATPGA